MARGQHHRIHSQDRLLRNRHRVAQEAARLISEHGIRDFRHAKIKAAERLGVGDEQSLPRNREVEDALREHQRLFHGASQPSVLALRREIAREAMHFMAEFAPRLVGDVLHGTANTHSPIQLHLFTDDADAPGRFLDSRGIAHEHGTRRLRMTREQSVEVPLLRFLADEVCMELCVLARDGLRQAPLDATGEHPMRRATLAELEMLLQEDEVIATEACEP